MPPYRKKLITSQAKRQHAIFCASKEGSDSDIKSLSEENKSSDESKSLNTSLDSNAIGEYVSDEKLSDTSNSEHKITREGEDQRDFPSGNDHASSKQQRGEEGLKNQVFRNRSSESENDSDAESRKEILRSAEKRIIRKVSTSESDSRNKRVCNRNRTSSESDSAPEDVTFEAGRKIAMEVNKQRVDSIHQEKLRKKEQRKKTLEKFKKQKEEKLIRLKQRQRNVENSSSSSSLESTPKPLKKHIPSALGDNGNEVGKKVYFSSGSDTAEKKTSEHQENVKSDAKEHRNLKRLPADILDCLQDQVVHKQKKTDPVENNGRVQPTKPHSKIKGCELQWDTDYIPLDSSTVTQFGVIPLDKVRKKTVAEEAAAFRQNMLYGNAVKRAPATLNSVRQQKLKACGMDQLVTRPVK